MSWWVSWMRAASAPWWSGRALVASVAQFCLVLFSLALMVLALSPPAR